MSKSPDAFRTISEVADWLEIQAHVLRFWESKFTQVKPVKRAGGRRYYRPSDMLLLGGIQHLLHDKGLSIKEVQALIREQGVQHVQDLSKPLDPEEAEQEADTPPPSKWADPAEQDTQKPRPKPVDRDPLEEEPQQVARKAAPPTPPPFSPPAPAPSPAPPASDSVSNATEATAGPAETTEAPAPEGPEATASMTAATGEMPPQPGGDMAAAELSASDVPAAAPASALPAEPQPSQTPPEPSADTAAHPTADADERAQPQQPPVPAGQIAMPLDLPDAAPPARDLPHSTASAPRSASPTPAIPGQQDFFGAPDVAESDLPPATPESAPSPTSPEPLSPPLEPAADHDFATPPPTAIEPGVAEGVAEEGPGAPQEETDAADDSHHAPLTTPDAAPVAPPEPITAEEAHLVEDDGAAAADLPADDSAAYPSDPDQPAAPVLAEPRADAPASEVTDQLAAAMAQAALVDEPPHESGDTATTPLDLPDLKPDPDAPAAPTEDALAAPPAPAEDGSAPMAPAFPSADMPEAADDDIDADVAERADHTDPTDAPAESPLNAQQQMAPDDDTVEPMPPLAPAATPQPEADSSAGGAMSAGVLSRLSALEHLPPDARGALAEIVRDLRNCLS
ncbi:MerR family transcriptional regulator [Phaeobacter sp. HF9A]|uniref:MerR family transcriptional regulator n=1 Tax=Phaeobacter sp. HF9A TaxID=2721561 RepID=UPI001431A6C7|nr:MerR family transcriptional regulator [Phaeobacter sp. HF9A]NIZ14392.1 MerR family transcriptional regulator [Phaeobacter sp. HF9A]